MEDRDDQRLEGLLKARSEDMGRGREPRVRRAPAEPAFEPPRSGPDREPEVPSARTCGDCGRAIPARRARALPSATRCLDCQRVFERSQDGP